jgi:hypothetical protein
MILNEERSFIMRWGLETSLIILQRPIHCGVSLSFPRKKELEP